MERVLVEVDDTAGAFHAAEVAIGLAAAIGAELRVVTVVEDHVLDDRLAAAAIPDAARRRAQGAVAMLDRVAARAKAAGVEAETSALSGGAAEQVLAAARRSDADLIVVALEHRHQARAPYLGAKVQHILEFAEVPVLVVPPRPNR
ncbi:MAG TPA: universal stress protein [Kribbella sp.]|nr:universal stress protein [Kribbella sp.]